MSLTLECTIGKPVQWDVSLLRDGSPLPLPGGTKLWFTIQRVLTATDLEAIVRVTEASGITILGDGSVRVRLSAAQTALLKPLVEYYCDLQVQRAGEDPDIPDGGSGRITGTLPATKSP